MYKKAGILLLLIFVISRVIFINSQPVFFDSAEYIVAFSNPNFFNALLSVHFPPHEGYIVLFWPVYQIAKFFTSDPAYIVILGQIVLASITIYCYYNFIYFISNKQIALFSTIIISLTPIFWISNVTIMFEISYISFYIISIYFLSRYLSKNKPNYLYLSTFFLTLSYLTYSAVLLWIPLYLYIVYSKKKNIFMKVLLITFFSLLICSLLRILLISALINKNLQDTFYYLYIDKITQAGQFQYNLKGVLILLRNFIPVLKNYTSLVVIISFISLIISFVKNKKYFLIGLLWILPIFYINQWWDSVFMGRYGILAGFGFAFLTAYFMNFFRKLIPILIIYMLIVTVPSLFLLKMDIPYFKERQFVQTLPKNSLLITSHFTLPILEKCCSFKILAVNRQDVGTPTIEKEINKYLAINKPVFVSSAALSDPYGLYTGPYVHPLTLSYINKFELNPMLTNYTLKEYKVINENDNVIIFKIVSDKNSPYPKVKNLRDHYRRLDYYDPLWRLYRYAEEHFNFAFYSKE